MSLTPDQLITLHLPRFYLHSEERFFPIHVEDYVSRCTVNRLSDGTLLADNISSLFFDDPLQYDNTDPFWSGVTLQLKPEEDVFRNGNARLDEATILVRYLTRNSKIYIVYILFFGFNKFYNVFLGAKSGRALFRH